jgi:glyoxylase I family protein
MIMTDTVTAHSAPAAGQLPARLHHTAFVVRDHRATRRFYEALLGLPWVATWTAVDQRFGADRVYGHTFDGLGDGSALAFFLCAHARDDEAFGPQCRPSPFIHLARKVDAEAPAAVQARLAGAGWDHWVLAHGSCASLYVTDPDGMSVERTRDHPAADARHALRRRLAVAELERWLAGDHRRHTTDRPKAGPRVGQDLDRRHRPPSGRGLGVLDTWPRPTLVGKFAATELQRRRRAFHQENGRGLSGRQTSAASPRCRACLTAPTASRHP